MNSLVQHIETFQHYTDTTNKICVQLDTSGCTIDSQKCFKPNSATKFVVYIDTDKKGWKKQCKQACKLCGGDCND